MNNLKAHTSSTLPGYHFATLDAVKQVRKSGGFPNCVTDDDYARLIDYQAIRDLVGRISVLEHILGRLKKTLVLADIR